MNAVGHDPARLAVYAHWPFCASKCPYCDFNSHVADSIDHARWRTAYLRELDHYAAQTSGRVVGSLFFGGGTPSLMEPATVAAVIAAVRAHWICAPDLEISLEANPTSAESRRFQAFADAGVNRLSLGVQALDDEALRFLGRRHDSAEAKGAIHLARRTFDRFSFDLIYARPGQSVAGWVDELRRAVDLAVGHLSVYQLTIEEGTAFFPRHARGDFAVPGEDQAADLFEATQSVLAEAGLPAYEISNHARAGQACRHNLSYWRYEDYLGIGPGAHGRLTLNGVKRALANHRAPAIWLQRVESGGVGAHPPETLDAETRAAETLMMGLRLSEGLTLDRFLTETDGWGERIIRSPARRRLVEEGLLEPDGDRLAATPAGRQRLNAVLAHLLG